MRDEKISQFKELKSEKTQIKNSISSKSAESASSWPKTNTETIQKGGSTPKKGCSEKLISMPLLNISYTPSLQQLTRPNAVFMHPCPFFFSCHSFLSSTADFESTRVCVCSLDPFPKSSIKNLTHATVLVTVTATSTLSHQFKLKVQCNCTTVGPTH